MTICLSNARKNQNIVGFHDQSMGCREHSQLTVPQLEGSAWATGPFDRIEDKPQVSRDV
jgi:hypothetical protein